MNLPIVCLIIERIDQYCQIRIDRARVIQPQLVEARRGITIQYRPIPRTRPEYMCQCLLIFYYSLDILLIFEVDIGLLPQLIATAIIGLHWTCLNDLYILG